jgi:large subunit ribosomal protein L10
MNREQKAAVVEEIVAELKGSEAIFAIDYRGISVPQAAELRAKLRDADATFRIVKNRLTARAADQAGTGGLGELLEGPTALTFVRGDAALAAKALNDFSRATEVLAFKGGLLGDQALSADEIRSIARLPAREVLHAQLVGTIAAPITGLVRGLSSLISGMAIALQQIHDQGLVTGEAPAEEAPAAEAPAEEPAPAEEAPAPADEPPAEEPAPPEDGDGETITESSGDPVVEGEIGSSAAGPEGEHSEEPAEGDSQADNETEQA